MNYTFEIFPWHANFATGIDRIDNQHRKIIVLLNQLAQQLAHPTDSQALENIFSELASYAVHHFQTEEGIWNKYLSQENVGQDHAEAHRKFVAAVSELRSENATQPLDVVIREAMSFLTHWLAFHILDSDRHLAKIVLALKAGANMEQAKRQAAQEMGGVTHTLIETILSMYDSISTRTLDLIKEVNQRQRAETELRLVIDNTLDGICITDANFVLIDANPAFYFTTEYDSEQVIGKNLKDIKGLDDHGDMIFSEALRDVGNWSGELQSRTKSGALLAEWLTISAVKDNDGEITHYVAVFSNVSQLISRQTHLEHLANRDVLTGLPNRLLLNDRFSREIAKAERTKEIFAVCYLDLDGFKAVNDTLGHAAGDKLLKEISRRIKYTVRNADTVARIGGDEFVILMGGIKSPENAFVLLNRLLEEIKLPVHLDAHTATVSASIGIAFFPQHGTEQNILLNSADSAMYAAKKMGKSRYCVAD